MGKVKEGKACSQGVEKREMEGKGKKRSTAEIRKRKKGRGGGK